MCVPTCRADFSFSLQTNSKSSVSGIRRAFVVAVHGLVSYVGSVIVISISSRPTFGRRNRSVTVSLSLAGKPP